MKVKDTDQCSFRFTFENTSRSDSEELILKWLLAKSFMVHSKRMNSNVMLFGWYCYNVKPKPKPIQGTILFLFLKLVKETIAGDKCQNFHRYFFVFRVALDMEEYLQGSLSMKFPSQYGEAATKKLVKAWMKNALVLWLPDFSKVFEIACHEPHWCYS